MNPLFFFTFIVYLTAVELKPRKGSGVLCTFKDKTFSPGESWHPYLEPFGFMFCMRCACTETGHVKCNTIKCPTVVCENPVKDPQQCCPRCTDEPRIPAGLRASVKSCRHNGTIYQPGETFTKHNLFPSRQTNQCVMCTCSNGNIFCALKTCQSLSCSSLVSVPDTCCMACKDGGNSGSSSSEDGNLQLNRGVRHSVDQCSSGAGEQQPKGRPDRPDRPDPRRDPHHLHPHHHHHHGGGGGSSAGSRTTPLGSAAVRTTPLRGLRLNKLNLKGAAETTVKILLQRKHQRACIYNGKTFSHGDMWHPVLGKVLECIVCSCNDGIQDCKRISCPSQYPCTQPQKSPGKCCKVCPAEVKATSSSSSSSSSSSNQTGCSPGYKNKLLAVYKVESSLKAHTQGAVVRVIAVERQSNTDLEVQVWKAVEGTGETGVLQLMEAGDIPKKDVMANPENYTLLTTVDEETWRKFREEGDNLSEVQSTACEDGIREILKFLNPKQTDGLCSP